MWQRYEEQSKDDPNFSVEARRHSTTCLHWCSMNTECEVVWKFWQGQQRLEDSAGEDAGCAFQGMDYFMCDGDS